MRPTIAALHHLLTATFSALVVFQRLRRLDENAGREHGLRNDYRQSITVPTK